MTELHERIRNMLDGRDFAVGSAVNKDGSPHRSEVWVDGHDDALVFTTTARRRTGAI